MIFDFFIDLLLTGSIKITKKATMNLTVAENFRKNMPEMHIYANSSCGVKIPIIGTFYYKNIFMQVISV